MCININKYNSFIMIFQFFVNFIEIFTIRFEVNRLFLLFFLKKITLFLKKDYFIYGSNK